ncbi:polysaccharide pyruvyl transferase family protein [Streptomyces sp. 796.1]|uniref:polysaccharide pyruvyl transferase family protein n=1 Tax=Streptomyces sp. 796.1 TaxID=3163029 RepID=UPI0039C90EDF
MGVFGLLGSGNLGNDGSLEAVLGYLRAEHPDAVVDALCGGPEAVQARYGIPATRLHWYRGEYRTASRAGAVAAKGVGKLVDAYRTAAWVRRHEVVIVPGMGVLEATLPLRPWGFPYALFLLSASGRLLGTRVALVGVGAAAIGSRPTRVLVRWSARLAGYRSYRDEPSRDAMRAMGVDTARDQVYPDLAFALPTPGPDTAGPGTPPGTAGPAGQAGTADMPGTTVTATATEASAATAAAARAAAATTVDTPPTAGTVCVGVMAFHGSDDDRARADQIHRRYLTGTTRFVRALVADGRPVRLLTGDEVDRPVVEAIRAAVDSPLVTAAEATSLADLMREMAAADAVVATRYHNLICALKAGTPTLALSYAAKSDTLLAQWGLAAYCHPAREVDADQLMRQFRELERNATALRQTIAEHNRDAARRLAHQFTALTAALFPAATHAPVPTHALREAP